MLLAKLQALGDYSFTTLHLPHVEDVIKAARQRVSRDVKEIEDLVEQTTEYDKIDFLLESFKKAAVLDEFISEEVNTRLRLLKFLRTEKEIDANEAVRKMIEDENYSGLGQFLEPLSKSKNQIRKNTRIAQKFINPHNTGGRKRCSKKQT